MKAIITKWECPSCGNLINKKEVLSSNSGKTKIWFTSPTACACGRKGSFNLLNFEPATALIKPDSELNIENAN